MAKRTTYIVELQHGCYLADIEGDPGRTLVLANARRFASVAAAERALTAARKYRPFRNAEVRNG